jgi:hypothetical protein
MPRKLEDSLANSSAKLQRFGLICGAPLGQWNSLKNRRMPLIAARTRYSLVKGKRIVRSVLTARLRDSVSVLTSLIILVLYNDTLASSRCGTCNNKKHT